MNCKVINKSNRDMSEITGLVNEFFPYAQKQMGFNRPVSLFLTSDEENSMNPLGKTGFYNPASAEITIFVDGRHPKDILRSISHELVHHAQGCRGEFDGDLETGDNYAQNNPHLREMERQAYELGNLCFRDWENRREEPSCSENKDMTLKQATFEDIVKEVLSEDSDPADSPTHEERLKRYHETGEFEDPEDEYLEWEEITPLTGTPEEDPDPGFWKRAGDAISTYYGFGRRYDPPIKPLDQFRPDYEAGRSALSAYLPGEEDIGDPTVSIGLTPETELEGATWIPPDPDARTLSDVFDEWEAKEKKALEDLPQDMQPGFEGPPYKPSVPTGWVPIGSKVDPSDPEGTLEGAQSNFGVPEAEKIAPRYFMGYLLASGFNPTTHGLDLKGIAYSQELKASQRIPGTVNWEQKPDPALMGYTTSRKMPSPAKYPRWMREQLATILEPLYTGRKIKPGEFSKAWQRLSDAHRWIKQGNMEQAERLGAGMELDNFRGSGMSASRALADWTHLRGAAGDVGHAVGAKGAHQANIRSGAIDAVRKAIIDAGGGGRWESPYTKEIPRVEIQENNKMNKTDKLLNELKQLFEQEESDRFPGPEEGGSEFVFPEQAISATVPDLEQTGVSAMGGGFGEYEVQSGENLGDVAFAFLGDRNRASEIAQLNNITNPDEIAAGAKLMIPPVEETLQEPDIEMEPTEIVGDPNRFYTVQEGDNLWDIAERELGDPNMATTIKDLNPDIDPDRIEPGQSLRMPTQSPTTFQDVLDASEEERESQPVREWWDKSLFETLTKKYTKR